MPQKYLDKQRPIYTRNMICKPDGTLDVYKVQRLLAMHVRLEELPLRVTYYARVSTEQEEQLHSLESQLKWYKEKIQENENWTLCNGYWDRGKSGTSTKRRKSFLKMIEDARKNMFDLIITKEVSRFARNTVDSLTYCRELLNRGIGVWFDSDRMHTFDPEVDFQLSVMSSVAQNESRKTSERVKLGATISIRSGVVLGNDRIYGYKKNNGKLMIDEQEAEMIRLIFDLYANKYYGIRKIARILDDKGYKNYEGRRISETTINRILKNPKYKGFYCGGKTSKFMHLSDEIKRLPQEEWVMYKDETGEVVPAIVPEELWDKANIIMNRKTEVHKDSGKTSGKSIIYPYSGKIFCEEHNSVFTHGIHRNKRKDGSEYRREVWQCLTYIKQGAKACNKPTLHTDEIDKILSDVISGMRIDKENILKRIDMVYAEAIKDTASSRKTDTLANEISQIKKRLDQLMDAYLDGVFTKEEVSERKQELNSQLTEKEATLVKLRDEQQTSSELANRAIEAKDVLEEILEFKDGLDRSVVDMLLDKIVVKQESTKKQVYLDIYLNCFGKGLSYQYQKNRSNSTVSGSNGTTGKFIDTETSICPRKEMGKKIGGEWKGLETSICPPLGVWWWTNQSEVFGAGNGYWPNREGMQRHFNYSVCLIAG